jgi:hypothetical protein
MKKYYKDGAIVEKPKTLIFNGYTYTPPTDEVLIEAGYIIKEDEVTLEEALSNKIEQIRNYDVSDNVNLFFINDIPLWLDRTSRTSLMARFNAEQAKGMETTNLWYEGMHLVLSIKDAIEMLLELEIYAARCFDATQKHLHNVKQFETIDEIIYYDHTIGYPAKLNLNIL